MATETEFHINHTIQVPHQSDGGSIQLSSQKPFTCAWTPEGQKTRQVRAKEDPLIKRYTIFFPLDIVRDGTLTLVSAQAPVTVFFDTPSDAHRESPRDINYAVIYLVAYFLALVIFTIITVIFYQ